MVVLGLVPTILFMLVSSFMDMLLYFLTLSLCMVLHLVICVLALFCLSIKVRIQTLLTLATTEELPSAPFLAKCSIYFFLSKFGDILCTSNHQFGLKRNHSTTM